MQKPANLASLATRLNNLEQKYEEAPSEPGVGDPALKAGLERLWWSTVDGAYSQITVNEPVYSNQTWYRDNGTSMSRVILHQGLPFETDINPYTSCLQKPFYEQVFKFDDDRFVGDYGLAHTVFGPKDPTGLGSDWVGDIRSASVQGVFRNEMSMIDILMGPRTRGFISQLSDQRKSLIDMIFGSSGIYAVAAHETAESLFELIAAGLTDLSNTLDQMSQRMDVLDARIQSLENN